MKLIKHPIEPNCKISEFSDWETDVWDKDEHDTFGKFYEGADFITKKYDLP